MLVTEIYNVTDKENYANENFLCHGVSELYLRKCCGDRKFESVGSRLFKVTFNKSYVVLVHH